MSSAINLSTTAISSLPEYVGGGGPVQPQSQNKQFLEPITISRPKGELPRVQTSDYNPNDMNIHKNPYAPDPLPAFIEPSGQNNFALPSKDIPMDTMQFTTDARVQPSFIPPPKLTSDFVGNYEKENEQRWIEYQRGKTRITRMEHLWQQLQMPIFVILLFFVFHLPTIQTILVKYISYFHPGYSTESIYGIFIQALLFGSAFYAVTQGIEFLAEI